ncbi:MAG: hypothetical protein DRN27_06715 [Thermoplasmata archaeon]|nr:MAG: hypothetical protein DRN27_06715 [Thermoplasmata archaeon]
MKKMIVIQICIMLIITTIIPITGIVTAGSEEYPEIIDETDSNVVNYLDIISAWFFENKEEPNYLYMALKIKKINPYRPKQHLTVHWEYNGIPCVSGMHIGYGNPWFDFTAGYGSWIMVQRALSRNYRGI